MVYDTDRAPWNLSEMRKVDLTQICQHMRMWDVRQDFGTQTAVTYPSVFLWVYVHRVVAPYSCRPS